MATKQKKKKKKKVNPVNKKQIDFIQRNGSNNILVIQY